MSLQLAFRRAGRYEFDLAETRLISHPSFPGSPHATASSYR